MELKSPETPYPWESWHMPSPLQKCENLDTSNPNLTQPCGLGGGPGVVALAAREQSAPIVPKARLLHVELAHNLQSPGVPSHTQVREPQSAMRRQEQPPVQGFRVPAVQWVRWTRVSNPGNPGKGGQCSPFPWQLEVLLWKKSLVRGGAHTYSTPSRSFFFNPAY